MADADLLVFAAQVGQAAHQEALFVKGGAFADQAVQGQGKHEPEEQEGEPTGAIEASRPGGGSLA